MAEALILIGKILASVEICVHDFFLWTVTTWSSSKNKGNLNAVFATAFFFLFIFHFNSKVNLCVKHSLDLTESQDTWCSSKMKLQNLILQSRWTKLHTTNFWGALLQ